VFNFPIGGFVQVLQIDAKREGGPVVRLRIPNSESDLPSKVFVITEQKFVD